MIKCLKTRLFIFSIYLTHTQVSNRVLNNIKCVFISWLKYTPLEIPFRETFIPLFVKPHKAPQVACWAFAITFPTTTPAGPKHLLAPPCCAWSRAVAGVQIRRRTVLSANITRCQALSVEVLGSIYRISVHTEWVHKTSWGGDLHTAVESQYTIQNGGRACRVMIYCKICEKTTQWEKLLEIELLM